jgi:uncharacterized membrane protein YvlD (DUF360 family)
MAWSGPSKPSSSSFDSRVSLRGVAVPRTSAELHTEAERPRREGLSIQTLMVAALASGVAAVVVSRIWHQGTIFASAMTPVVVAIVSEAIRRPIESERVRRPVRAVTSGVRPRSGRTPNVIAPPAPGVERGLEQREDGIEPGPVRVYGSGANRVVRTRRKLPLKAAIVTGLIGFVIAAAALTLPELIFGGSVVGGQRDTTYFGGGGSGSAKTSDEKTKDKQGGTTDTQSTDQTTTDQQPTDSTSTTPNTDTQPGAPPAGSQPPPSTGQTTPPPSSPAPTTPAPTTPAPTSP